MVSDIRGMLMKYREISADLFKRSPCLAIIMIIFTGEHNCQTLLQYLYFI